MCKGPHGLFSMVLSMPTCFLWVNAAFDISCVPGRVDSRRSSIKSPAKVPLVKPGTELVSWTSGILFDVAFARSVLAYSWLRLAVLGNASFDFITHFNQPFIPLHETRFEPSSIRGRMRSLSEVGPVCGVSMARLKQSAKTDAIVP